jgi:hypothetical protein
MPKTMDWTTRRAELDDRANESRARGDDPGALICDSLAALVDEFEQARKTIAHMEDRLAGLTTAMAKLEARIHEEVE